jgi:fumarylacetoacetate (FAA) hydrolase
MVQRASDDFLGPCQAARFASEDWGIDFGAGLAVVTADMPMGCSADQALEGVRLLMLANDWRLRNRVPDELSQDFGPLQDQPTAAFSPVAATPDELGEAWQGGRAHLTLSCAWNGKTVGLCEAGPEMTFHFGQLIAHLCQTRNVRAGAIVGSGPVSNKDWARGYSCIAEKRAIETLESGAPATPFMRFGDTIRIEMKGRDGLSVFGAIEQPVAPAQ